MKRLLPAFVLLLAVAASAIGAADDDPLRVLEPGKAPADQRLTRVRTLNDKDFFFTVPASKEAWEARRQQLREQVLVANGLWPLPPKAPLQPTVHGKIARDGYTVEKVFFASYPGFYVTGNLYRPTNPKGKVPGVLCPHGHWGDRGTPAGNGRFYQANDKTVEAELKSGAEKTKEGAKYPLQARCAQLARMGCVVFHYDMVGYGDSTQIYHPGTKMNPAGGFADAAAELRLQSFMGLQTWDSIRALDFLVGLPEVDPKRIGVTGASGGGTQTFILCAVDDRPAAAFPAVMVSTEMQGGCICENCSYLRQGTGNVELAGLFAPKPLAMSGARDWTINIETRGLPELKALYKLYGAEDKVLAKCFPEFGHNYNQVSREVMYNWFNKHLQLGHQEPVTEKPFEPVPPKELSVFDEQHPRPKDAVTIEQLRKYLTETSDRQLAALQPTSPATRKEFQRVVGTALRVMIHDRLPGSDEVECTAAGPVEERDGLKWRKLLLGRKGQGEQVPAMIVTGPQSDGNTVVVWVHPEGKGSLMKDGKLVPAARAILDRKAAILAVDVFLTGELRSDKSPPVNTTYAGYTFGYNRPVLANRVHDILTAIACARKEKLKTIHLVGFERAGPWVVLARGLCGDAVARTAADLNQFQFDQVTKTDDEMMLPGAVKYGGLEALTALAAPGDLVAHNVGKNRPDWVRGAYAAAGAGEWQWEADRIAPEKVLAWLLR
jgi:dienelactone hydrolase